MPANQQRIDRFLSNHLGINRKQIKRLLASTRILVNGERVFDTQKLVDNFSHIICDGQTLQHNLPVYLMLHKPAGVLSATRDPEHRTALDLIDHPRKHTLHIAGRLDLNSTGLLLLTNDGRWSKALSIPDRKIPKVYLVTVAKPLTPEYIDVFAAGMYFAYENLTTLSAILEILDERLARVTLVEGRYHQIKRMFGRFRNPVLGLHRISVGNIRLDPSLASGKFRELTEDEHSEVRGQL